MSERHTQFRRFRSSATNALLYLSELPQMPSAHLAKRRYHEVHKTRNENPISSELLANTLKKMHVFSHNIASVEQHGKEEFDAALRLFGLGLEVDVSVVNGEFFAAHGARDFNTYAKQHPEAWKEQKLRTVIGKIVDANHDHKLHFDLKLGPFDSRALPKLANVINEVPDSTKIFISGRSWRLNDGLSSYLERDVTLLYTIDGNLGNTFDAFVRLLKKNPAKKPLEGIGVSLHAALATPEKIQLLKKMGLYILVFPVDTPEAAIHFTNLGVDGITTNNFDFLPLAQHKPSPHPALIPA